MTEPFQWTPERVETMLRMIRVEGASMRAVGDVLGCSRNSIIGKYHRVCKNRGLSLQPRRTRADFDIKDELIRNTVPKRAYGRRAKPATFKPGVGFILKGLTLPEPSRAGAVGIVDATGCKWPVGEDEKIAGWHVFCNAAKHSNSPYCEYHFHVSRPHSVPREKVKRFVIPTSLLRAGVA